MITIVVDAALRAKLLAAGEMAEFRGEDGAVIGQFVAANGTSPPVDFDDVTDEELDRRARGTAVYDRTGPRAPLEVA